MMNTILPADSHFFSVDNLFEMGLSYYRIKKLVEEGTLVKVNKSMYENANYEGEESDYSVVAAYAPKGVVCMLSAARYYGLTTYLPDAVDVAIERSMKISTLPDWPDVKIWYFPEKRYRPGICDVSDNSGKFKLYDVEKTVVDILYYRNKVGIDETKEILKSYLNREDRDIIKLHRYAEDLGCKRILGTYLEVLL